jgi:hypothetical protein
MNKHLVTTILTLGIVPGVLAGESVDMNSYRSWVHRIFAHFRSR